MKLKSFDSFINESSSDGRPEWTVDYRGILGGARGVHKNPHREAPYKEKLKILGVKDAREFINKYKPQFEEIGEHFGFGKFVGVHESMYLGSYDTIKLYYETGSVGLCIDDLEKFPGPTENTSDKRSYMLIGQGFGYGPYIPKELVNV